MMQKTLKKSKKENPEKVKSYIVTENGLGKFLKCILHCPVYLQGKV